MTNIAIIGNPNSGKTTLFNRLTGAKQQTGNWPGVTVERICGQFSQRINHQKVTFQLHDLPGIYSLHDPLAIDAQIAQRYLHSGEPQQLIYVLDANHLQRQLLLLLQIKQLGLPMIIAVNMLDVATQSGKHIDLAQLSALLELPVVGISAAKNLGMDELLTQLRLGKANASPQPNMPDAQLLAQAAKISEQCVQQRKQTKPNRLDNLVLHPLLGLPIFLMVMYLLFGFSVNVGGIFIDFFDQITQLWLVDTSRYWLSSIHAPLWLITLICDGLGAGVQLISTFIPVIGCLYLALSVLESSGYMARAAFIVDSLMQKMGLPGQAFIPLIVGFGCNVPAVMASRSLQSHPSRLLTIFVAPFMSCGARLTVYVFIGAAFFPQQAQNAIFALYLLGILVAIFSSILIHKFAFKQQYQSSISELPNWHRPILRNILTQTWHRLKSFCLRAGKSILLVVCVLSLISSYGTDGKWGHQSSDQSYLAVVAKSVTPIFKPIGIAEENWPATVGLVTGLFAKEVVVGTLDALYQPNDTPEKSLQAPELLTASLAALVSIGDNFVALSDVITDPLGLTSTDFSDQSLVNPSTQGSLLLLFASPWAAFSYLIIILLYAPCVATIGAMIREGGNRWMSISMLWSLVLSYALAVICYQASRLMIAPQSSLLWIGAMLGLIIGLSLLLIKLSKQQQQQSLIIAVG